MNNYIDAGDTANTEVSIFDYGDKCLSCSKPAGCRSRTRRTRNSISCSGARREQGRRDLLRPATATWRRSAYNHCIAYDKNFQVIKEFKGGGDHFGNFIAACLSRKPEDLNAHVREGHLSAGISHLGTSRTTWVNRIR